MDNSTVLTQDTTVTAQYTAKTYTVTIYPNGASGSNKTYSVPYGTSWSIPSCPFSRSGYNFGGYKTGSSSGTSYSAGGKVTVTGDLSLYCQWTIAQYTVSIYPNGASGSTKTYKVNKGASFSVPSCPFSRSGYNFVNYKTGASSGTSYSAGSKITVNSNVSLYCQWAVVQEDFVFNVVGKVQNDVPMLGTYYYFNVTLKSYPSSASGKHVYFRIYNPSVPGNNQMSDFSDFGALSSSKLNVATDVSPSLISSSDMVLYFYYGTSTSSCTQLGTVKFNTSAKNYTFSV